MSVEKMLTDIGDFHQYQFVLMGFFCIINLLCSINYYSQTIISFIPEHWCYTDLLSNNTIEEIKTIYSDYPNPSCTPLNETLYYQTHESQIFNLSTTDGFPFIYYTNVNQNIYQKNSDFTLIPTGSSQISNNKIEVNTNKQRAECNQFIYNLDYGYESMTSELNWVCNSAWKSTLGQSMFFIGSVIGSLMFGILADKIGRLKILIISNIMAMLGNLFTIFTRDVVAFSVSRFIAGLATDSNFVMMYILVMEYIRPSMRTFGLNICIGLFYCIGSMITPWIAVAVGNWKMFLIVTSTPILIVPFFYFWVQESALWLISKNDIDGAIKCFQRVAKFNGRPLSQESISEFRTHCHSLNVNKKSESATLIDLFRTPRLRKNTLILFFKSMVITLCYDAISRNVEGLGISPFIVFSLSATAIFPACIVLLLIQDVIGRKAMASSSLLVSGIFTAATGFIIAYNRSVQDPILLISLAIIGRFGVTVAYNSGAQYATELIPTCVRGQGVAAVHVAGYALTFFSSYILYLSNIWLAFPALILGSLCLIGSVLVLFLPETLNRTIPSTLSEGEEFGKGERFFDFSCFEKPVENTNYIRT